MKEIKFFMGGDIIQNYFLISMLSFLVELSLGEAYQAKIVNLNNCLFFI